MGEIWSFALTFSFITFTEKRWAYVLNIKITMKMKVKTTTENFHKFQVPSLLVDFNKVRIK